MFRQGDGDIDMRMKTFATKLPETRGKTRTHPLMAWHELILLLICGVVAGASLKTTGPYTLAPLPYAENALEPYIDARTVKLHHDLHQGGAVTALNKAMEGATEYSSMTPAQLLVNLDKIPEAVRQAVKNNAGSDANHTMYWMCMGPGHGGEPSGPVADAIKAGFGGFPKFKEKFTAAALARCGSGYAWLVDDHGKLVIMTTANSDSPITEGKTPLLVVDVWEHAYYLKHQNKRADYIAGWWNLVNWDEVGRRLKVARGG